MSQPKAAASEREIIALPYTRECFVCGEDNTRGMHVRFEAHAEEIVARVKPPAETCGYRTIVHGGIQSTLLDETMGWAPAFVNKRMCVAAELTVRFLARVPVGMPLIVRGRFIEDKRLFWKCEGSIEDDEGTVYATSRGTYVPLSREESERIERETLIYPEGTPRIFST